MNRNHHEDFETPLLDIGPTEEQSPLLEHKLHNGGGRKVQRRTFGILGGVLTALMSIGLLPSAAVATSRPSPLTRADIQQYSVNCGGINVTSFIPTAGNPLPLESITGISNLANSPVSSSATRWIVPQCSKPIPAGSPEEITSVHAVTPKSGQSTVAQVSSSNWSGYLTSGYSGNEFSAAASYWTIPNSFPGTGPGNTYESSWAGLDNGLFDNTALLQAGTETDIAYTAPPGVITNYAWWELYPMNGQVRITNLDVVRGSTNYAEVEHTGGTSALAIVCTTPPGGSSTCTNVNITFNAPFSIDGSQAECIAERTAHDGGLPYLTDINGMPFTTCSVYYHTAKAWAYMGNVNNASMNMDPTCKLGSPWIATPNSIQYQANFTINWLGYGTQESGGC